MDTKAGTKKPRLGGKPRQWDKRITITVRILPPTHARLAAATGRDSDHYAGMGPQDFTEAAINHYCDQLGIPAANQLDQGEQS